MTEQLVEQLQKLPDFFGHHVQITLLAMVAGIVISIPLAIWATRRQSLQGAVMGAASVVQTIPSIALLALMVSLLGTIGFVPALIALFLYSMLPILRNTVAGIQGVDPALIEAARGMGMTENQMLTKVQLPLAAPIIIAGIRTSTVWVVGIATLATPVGQKSLGNYIFPGLSTRNNYAILTGVVAAAGLALLLDYLIRKMELASVRRSRAQALAAGLGVALIAATGLAPRIQQAIADGRRESLATVEGSAMQPATRPAAAEHRPTVKVGAKTFTEQFILSQMLAEHLQGDHFRANVISGMGSGILFDALAQGNVDIYVDYSGTIWATVMKRQDHADAQTVLEESARFLREKYGVVSLGPLGFENAYALAMTRKRAEELGIRTIADLARHAPDMTIGGDFEFFARPEWQRVRDSYGLRFKDSVGLDATLMYSAVKQGQVDAIVAFSSDGRIAAFDLLVLEDPQQAFPPYDAILLVSPQGAQSPELLESLGEVTGAIDDQTMREANKAVDVDGEPPEQVGRRLAKTISSQ